jgi:uracil-DNA glycosylase family 4
MMPADITPLEQEIVNCRRCPRLVEWREQVAMERRRAFADWEYWGKPVPGFGDADGRVLVVGLAPGAHGANRTGRMFTGDSSGDFLYRALYKTGFASQPTSSHREDGLELMDLYISAVCRCAPPGNKPAPAEIINCLPFLEAELRRMNNLEVIVTLGRIAFQGIERLYRKRGLTFGHGLLQSLGDGLPAMITSYHPSRQNTQTGRLTEKMFDEVWQKARQLLK